MLGGQDDRSMLLMAILPIMLICAILVATVLDRRGYLGPSFRFIGVTVPLAAIAASLSLGAAALLFAHVGDAFSHDFALGAYVVAAGMFHLLWAQLYVLARAPWAAAAGALGTVAVIVGALVFNLLRLPGLADSAAFLSAFELALLLLLTPSIAPTLEASLAERKMPVQRAVVLGGFGVATVALFTCTALIGGALPA